MNWLDITKRLIEHKLQAHHAEETASNFIAPEHTDQLKLMNFTAENGQWNARLKADSYPENVVRKFATGIGDYFIKYGGTNYVELSIYNPQLGPLTLTIQRTQGKTANQLKREAETRAEQAEARVVELENRDAKTEHAIEFFTSMRDEALARARSDEQILHSIEHVLKPVFPTNKYRGINENIVWACEKLADHVSELRLAEQELAEQQASNVLLQRQAAKARQDVATMREVLRGVARRLEADSLLPTVSDWMHALAGAESPRDELLSELVEMLWNYRDREHDEAIDMGCDAGNWDGGSTDSCEHCQKLRSVAAVDELLKKAGIK